MPPPKLRLPLSGLFVCSGAQPTSLRIAGHPFPYFGSKCYTLKAFLVNSVLPFPPTHRAHPRRPLCTHHHTISPPPPPPPCPPSPSSLPPESDPRQPSRASSRSLQGQGPSSLYHESREPLHTLPLEAGVTFFFQGEYLAFGPQGQAPTSVDFPRGNVSYLSKKQARAFFQGEHLLAQGQSPASVIAPSMPPPPPPPPKIVLQAKFQGTPFQGKYSHLSRLHTHPIRRPEPSPRASIYFLQGQSPTSVD